MQNIQLLLRKDLYHHALEVHLQSLEEFHTIVRDISGDACPIGLLPPEFKSPEKNMFSCLFLSVILHLFKESSFIPLYAFINQCMRAWVTGCDNLLDDEYKTIFPFAIKEKGSRIPSVFTLLLTDRALTRFMTEKFNTPGLITKVHTHSFRLLVPCALEECEEEIRPVEILHPFDILSKIHLEKTALLFSAPLGIPELLESVDPALLQKAKEALQYFGHACQILDDAKDMPLDLIQGRHNYLVSLEADRLGQKKWLEELRKNKENEWTSWEKYPDTFEKATWQCEEFFYKSFESFNAIGMQLMPSEMEGWINLIFTLLKVPLRK